MSISKRAQIIPESITLKLNTLAGKLKDEGREVFNLTAGQLPCFPPDAFIEDLYKVAKETKSFQYSPVKGTEELRKNFTNYLEQTRGINIKDTHDSLVGNGGKAVLTNIISSIVDPGDEVILFAPYWISYPHMVGLCEGTLVMVGTGRQKFVPDLKQLEEKITKKTKVIILNSPSNPSGIYLSDEWMRDFAVILKKHPNILVISDEIYYELAYDGKKPKYFYQFDKSLLAQTFIVHGISKSLACTGLRIGWCVGPKEYINAIGRLQGHIASGANSLTQEALKNYNLFNTENFLKPMLDTLRENSGILKSQLHKRNLGHIWYEINSAFYFMLNLKELPYFNKISCGCSCSNTDQSFEMCKKLMEETGVVIVPSSDFGIDNHARISMVLPAAKFQIAVVKILDFFTR